MLKIAMASMTLLFLIGLMACANNSALINEALNARGQLLAKVIGAIEKDPTASGIKEARKMFDAEKAAAKAKWDVVKAAKPSDKERMTINDAGAAEASSFIEFQKKHPLSGSDKDEFMKLYDDFKETFSL